MLKTRNEALDSLIEAIDEPKLKPIEVIGLMESLPVDERGSFGSAMQLIGAGLRQLKAIRERLENDPDDLDSQQYSHLGEGSI